MRQALWLLLTWLGATSVSATSAWADTVTLEPFVATYSVSYRGLDAGTLRMELRKDSQPNRYIFETHANPSALARLVVGRDAVEHTTFELTSDGLRPIQWRLEDGKSGANGDGDLKFDWAANKVTGTFEGKPVDLPIQPGLQDRLSIQIAVSTALAQGREPGSIVMVNGDRTREYSYARGANEQLDTKVGKLDTVIYESTRPNSNRVSRVWHAPSLEFLPVRAEQIRKGKVETVMQLVAVEK